MYTMFSKTICTWYLMCVLTSNTYRMSSTVVWNHQALMKGTDACGIVICDYVVDLNKMYSCMFLYLTNPFLFTESYVQSPYTTL